MDSMTSLFIVYRYDSTTRTFTVPSGGDGLYYFSVYLSTISNENAYFNVEINGQLLCSAVGEMTDANSGDAWATSCSGVAEVMEGKMETYGRGLRLAVTFGGMLVILLSFNPSLQVILFRLFSTQAPTHHQCGKAQLGTSMASLNSGFKTNRLFFKPLCMKL